MRFYTAQPASRVSAIKCGKDVVPDWSKHPLADPNAKAYRYLLDMFILCYEVIKLNFKGFFKRVGIQSGSLIDKLRKGTPTSENGETSTSDASASLN